jgi:hypothetical protein
MCYSASLADKRSRSTELVVKNIFETAPHQGSSGSLASQFPLFLNWHAGVTGFGYNRRTVYGACPPEVDH